VGRGSGVAWRRVRRGWRGGVERAVRWRQVRRAWYDQREACPSKKSRTAFLPAPYADHWPVPSWPTKWRAHSGKMAFSIEPFLVTATPMPLGLLPSAARMPPTSDSEMLIFLPFGAHGREWMSTGESTWPLRHVVSALVTW